MNLTNKYVGLFSPDRSESDVSFEELEENDHLRVQKRQLGGTSNDKNECDTKDSPSNKNVKSPKESKTNDSDSKDEKEDQEESHKLKKKALFDSDLVQLDLFGPFPIGLYDSNYLRRSLNRIVFKENKINYLRPKFAKLCELSLFKKIFVYMFWIVYAMKFQKHDKEEILCELKVALREKLRKLFILVPAPKDKYYELIPLILSLAIEVALNSEITTITEKKNNVTYPPKNTYDYECKQDLFQTVYYEIIGFLPSTYFIENIILKYTKEENKLGLSSIPSLSKKTITKGPILKGVNKNL